MSGPLDRTVRVAGPLDAPALLDRLAACVPRLSRLGDGEHLLRVRAADHRTLAALFDDLLAFLAGEDLPSAPAGLPPTLPAPGSREDARNYWRARLAPPLGVVELAPGQDRATPGTTATGTAVAVPVAAVDTAGLLTAVQVLLRRYCGVTDVLVGLPVAPAGFVVQRGDLTGDPAVADLTAATARALDEAMAHRALPLAELMRAAGATTPATMPLCQVAVVVDTLAAPGFGPAAVDFALGETGPVVTAGAFRVQPVAMAERELAAPLTVVAALGRDRPRISLLADPELLPAEFRDGLARDLATVVDGMAAGGPVSRLLPRPAPEVRPAPDLAAAHVTAPDFVPFADSGADTDSIVDRFRRQADRHGDRPAVVTPAGTVTYAELAGRAGAIASALRHAGAGPDTRVGLLLDHGAETIAAILGTLWTGAAYVPLDPAYPAERLTRTLADADAAVVVTTAGHRPLLATLGAVGRVVDLDEVRDAAPPPSAATADGPAYVLYTSGSTGRPKGVVQTHRNVLFQVRNHTDNLRVAPGDRVSLLSSFSFDMAVTDLFSALLNGAASVPLDLRGGDLTGLAATLTGLGVTVYHSTPTVYRHLLAGGERLPTVRVVLLGGEPVTWEDVERSRNRLAPAAVFVNGYGATEVSFAAQHHLPLAAAPARTGVVPIGHPLDGIEIVLLAPDGRPAALHGEIAIRSRHVSVGYWRDPDLNERRFRTHGDGTRTYLTGDLGRRLPDGTLAYLGRDDRQVKIRGYRVELGEIEAVLHTDPAVGQAVAVARATANGAEIVAYVEGARADPGALRARLAEALPHFMVPRAIVALAALPLTPTGKVDVRALPAPAPPRARSAPPDGPVETAIAEAWCQVLGVPAVGREDNFFEAGGSSLLLATVAERLGDRLGARVGLTTLLEHPTVAALAGFVSGATTGDAALVAVRDRAARRRQARTRRGP